MSDGNILGTQVAISWLSELGVLESTKCHELERPSLVQVNVGPSEAIIEHGLSIAAGTCWSLRIFSQAQHHPTF